MTLRAETCGEESEKEIELWRDPAMLRLQPSRMRLWTVYRLVPYLGLLFVLLTPWLCSEFLVPYLNSFTYIVKRPMLVSDSTGKMIPTEVQVAIYYGNEHRDKMLRALSFLLSLIWGLTPLAHLAVIRAIALGPRFRWLARAYIRRDLKLSRLDPKHFLGAFLRPHATLLLSSWSVLILFAIIQRGLLLALQFSFSIWDVVLHLSLSILLTAIMIWSIAFEDFRPLTEHVHLGRKLRDGLLVGLLTWSFSLPIGMHGAALQYGDSISLILVNIVTLLLSLGFMFHTRILWRRMCRFLGSID